MTDPLSIQPDPDDPAVGAIQSLSAAMYDLLTLATAVKEGHLESAMFDALRVYEERDVGGTELVLHVCSNAATLCAAKCEGLGGAELLDVMAGTLRAAAAILRAGDDD